MGRYRVFAYASCLSAAVALAALTLWYVFAWPTSDVRTRMYILLYLPPGPVMPFLLVGASLCLVGASLVRVSGWRGGWAVMGAVAGGGFGVLLLWSRVLGRLAWLYDEQVTVTGQLTRASLAIAFAAAAFWIARRGSRTAVAA